MKSQKFSLPKNKSLLLIDSIDQETQNEKSNFNKLSKTSKFFMVTITKLLLQKKKGILSKFSNLKEDIESNSSLSFEEEKILKKINTLKKGEVEKKS